MKLFLCTKSSSTFSREFKVGEIYETTIVNYEEKLLGNSKSWFMSHSTVNGIVMFTQINCPAMGIFYGVKDEI